MKLDSVSLYSGNTEVLSFSMNAGATNGRFQIKRIVGLDADELSSRFYGRGASGQNFNEMTLRKKREVVIRAVLTPHFLLNESYSDVRDEVYRAIAQDRTGMVQLRFNNASGPIAVIDGHFIKFEVPYFGKTPELQLTIECDDALLRGFAPVAPKVADLPTSGNIVIWDSISTAPHGFTLDITFTAAETQWEMNCADGQWSFIVEPGDQGGQVGFQIGDRLYLSSTFGNKQLFLERGGTEYPLTDKLVTGSHYWPVVFPKKNEYICPQMGSFTWNELSYYPAYWGV